MKINEGKVLMLLSGILSGIVITSFIINTPLSPITFLSNKQYQDEKIEQTQLTSEIDKLHVQLVDLQSKVNQYQSSSKQNKNVYAALSTELKQLQLNYGSTEVEGPGISVTISDRTYYIDDWDRMMENNLTHNTDILGVVHDLVNAGAEAVAVNGQRIGINTAINCMGPTLGIQNGDSMVLIVPPFRIDAIGDPAALHLALTKQNSYYSRLVKRQLNLNIEEQKNIKISPLVADQPKVGE